MHEPISKVQTITVRALPEGYRVKVDDGRPAELAKDDIWLGKILTPKGIWGSSFQEILAEIREKGLAVRTITIGKFFVA
jgi:hypothetical protein